MLDVGAPLVGMLRGAARPAVAGYVAGGRAALAAIAAADYDVLSATPLPGKRRTAGELVLASRGGGDAMTAQLPRTTAEVSAAYQHCEQVTRTQARNFSYGIRLLPGDKRRALSAVYAFARRIDDIGDGNAARRGQAHRAGGGPRGRGRA